MFVPGTGWGKKLVGMALVYVLFLALGLIYAARIFHERHLMWDGGLLILPLLALVVVWFQFKKRTDPAFAARAAERKAKAAQDKTAKNKQGNQAALYIILFHLLFLVSVLAFKAALDGVALAREPRLVLATMAATALASLTVMALAGWRERRGQAART